MRAQLINKRANYINHKTSLSSRVIVPFSYVCVCVFVCICAVCAAEMCVLELGVGFISSSLRLKLCICCGAWTNGLQNSRANIRELVKWSKRLAITFKTHRIDAPANRREFVAAFVLFYRSVLVFYHSPSLSLAHHFSCRPRLRWFHFACIWLVSLCTWFWHAYSRQNNWISSLPLVKCAFHQLGCVSSKLEALCLVCVCVCMRSRRQVKFNTPFYLALIILKVQHWCILQRLPHWICVFPS